MNHKVLINLKFRKNEGATDLQLSNWNSMVIYKNSKTESIDYSAAGRFSGECAYFDGEISQLKKVNGDSLDIKPNTDMTISLWFNSNLTESNMKQFFLTNDTDSPKNSFFMRYDDIHETLIFSLISNDEKPFESENAISKYKSNDWNYIVAVRKNKTIYFFLNGESIGVCPDADSSEFLFSNKGHTIIGRGNDTYMKTYASAKGYLDDFVLLNDAIDILGTSPDYKVKIPEDYLMNELNPALKEEDDSDVWDDKEKEFSRYDHIVDITEWKRFNTKSAIDVRENGLVPYRLRHVYSPIVTNVPEWVPPVPHEYYSKNDRVIYNGIEMYVNKVAVNTSIPGVNDDWEFVGSFTDYYPDWSIRNKAYRYLECVIYNRRIYQSQINYNRDVPSYWTKLDDGFRDDSAKKWDENVVYKKDELVSSNDALYKSNIDNNINHKPGYNPNWKEISRSNKGIKKWVEPNSYMVGDTVKQDGVLYYSIVNNNIWEPKTHSGVQWKKFDTWKMPKFTSVYHKGDKVNYNGKTYICSVEQGDKSVIAPDDYRERSFYKSVINSNTSKPGAHLSWKEIYEKDLPKDEIETIPEWIKGVKYSNGSIVKVSILDWQLTDTSDIYVADGVFTVNRDFKAIGIKLYTAHDNAFFNNKKERRRFKINYRQAYDNDWIGAYIVLINGKFIPWDDIVVVRSDRYVTLFFSGIPRDTEVSSFKIINIPFKVTYSDAGYIPADSIKVFGFNEDGSLGNKYIISTSNTKIRVLEYPGTKFDNVYIDTNLTHKITKSNLFVFKESGELVDESEYRIEAANIFNMYTDGNTKYRVYCIWDYSEDPSEDNLSLIPNQEDVRKYIIYENEDQDKAPINLHYLKKEFDFKHTIIKNFDKNIDASMHYIFGYNKNKYDDVYEKIRPVNMEYYDEETMGALKRTITIRLTPQNRDLLIHNYIMLNDYTLIELNEDNIQKYMNKTLQMKIRKEIRVKLTDDKIKLYMGAVIKDDTQKETVKLTDKNKDQYKNKNVIIKGISLFDEYTNETDSIIMSRDIYQKTDSKNNTHVLFFKHGMLPQWYNNIKYTNDQFYIGGIPKSKDRHVSFAKTPHQIISVVCNGIHYNNRDNPNGFWVEEGAEFTASIEAEVGFIAGKLNTTGGIVNDDTLISATDPTVMKFTVTVIQSSHQNIVVTVNGNDEFELSDTPPGSKYTKTFSVIYGTRVSAALTADEGYNPGRLNITEATVTKNITIRATEDAGLQLFTITLRNMDSDNQDFFAIYKGREYRDRFVGAYKDTYTLQAKSKSIGYNVGTITDPGNGVITKDTTVTLSSAEVRLFKLRVEHTDCQTLTVVHDGKTYNEGDVFWAKYGDEYSVTLVSDKGFNVGKPQSSDNTLRNFKTTIDRYNMTQTVTADGRVTGEGNIYATPTNVKSFTVNVEQSPHQTIEVTCNGKKYRQSFEAPYGAKITAEIVHTDEGYNPGRLNITEATVTKNITIQVSDASAIIVWYNLNIIQSPHQTIYVSSDNTTHTESYRIKKGTQWYAKVTPEFGYISQGLKGPNGGTISSDVTVSANEPKLADYVRTISMYTANEDNRGYCSQYSDNKLDIGGRSGSSDMMNPKGEVHPNRLITSNGFTVCLEAFFTLIYLKYKYITVGRPGRRRRKRVVDLKNAFYRTYLFISNQEGASDAYKIKRIKVHTLTPIPQSNNGTNFEPVIFDKYYIDNIDRSTPDGQEDYTQHQIDHSFIGGERGGFTGKMFYYDVPLKTKPYGFNLYGVDRMNANSPTDIQFAFELFDH